MKYLAILKDALLQTLDCKSLYVMFIMAGLIMIFCASISYSPMDDREAIQDQMSILRMVVQVRGLSSWAKSYEGLVLEVGDVRRVPAGGREGYEFALTVGPVSEWRQVVRHWDAVKRGRVKAHDDPVPDVDVDPEPELEAKYLRERLRERMIPEVEVKDARGDGDRRIFAVRMVPWTTDVIEKVERVHLFFGLWTIVSFVPAVVSALQIFLTQVCAGWIGVMVGIVFTAGFIPNMMQRGSLDVLLARPVSRPTLLVYRFLGGLAYAVLTGAVFILGSWLTISARSGIWNWGYLATLGTLVLFFAVLYSIGVFSAVATRSTIAAIVMPLVVWGSAFTVNQGRNLIDSATKADPTIRIPGFIRGMVDVCHFILPKTTDMNDMNQYLIAKGAMGTAMEAVPDAIPEVAWVRIFLTAGIYIVVMLGLACWIFSRRDY